VRFDYTHSSRISFYVNYNVTMEPGHLRPWIRFLSNSLAARQLIRLAGKPHFFVQRT